MDFDAAVIGAGPGGLVSTLYLRRFLRSTILVSQGPPRASWIPKTHNILGYRAGISGAELLKRLQEQVTDLGIERAVGDFKVSRIPGKGFRIESTDAGERQTFTASKVVIATGMTDVHPNIKNLDRLRRRGVLRYCPVCDAFEYANKKLAILASGKHGLRASLFLSDFSRQVDVLWQDDTKPDAQLTEQLGKRGIRVHRAKLVAADDGRLGGVTLLTRDITGKEKTFVVDACYVSLGSEVNDSAFGHLQSLRRDSEGFLITDSHQELSVPGLFAVGDCVSGLKQISVAAGHAAIAATRIHNQLATKAREKKSESAASTKARTGRGASKLRSSYSARI